VKKDVEKSGAVPTLFVPNVECRCLDLALGWSHFLVSPRAANPKERKPKQDDAKAEVLTANSRETEVIAKFNCNLPLASSPLTRAGVLELSESCGVRLDTSQQS
jgi:hypothetical protein